MKRKIALISQDASPLAEPGKGGNRAGTAYVARVACELAWMGIQVDVFTCEMGREWWDVCEGRGNIRVIRVPTGSGASEAERLREYMQESLTQEHTPDLIHAMSWVSGWLAAELKTDLGIPFVVNYEACAEEFMGEDFERYQRVVRLADAILVRSARERENLLERYDADPTYIVVIQQDFDRELPPGEIYTVPAEPDSQSCGGRLAALYEDILAVRRVMIPSLPTPVLAAGQYGYLKEWQGDQQVNEARPFTLETAASSTTLQIPVHYFYNEAAVQSLPVGPTG